MDLQAKGVDKALIECALSEEYDSDEKEKIVRLLQKRSFHPDTASDNEKRKNYQFLIRRGYKSKDILNVMREMPESNRFEP